MSIAPWSAVISAASTVGLEYYSNSTQLIDGTIVLAYRTGNNGNVTFQRFSDAGVAIGSPILSGYGFLSQGAQNPTPHLASLTDGGFVMTLTVPTNSGPNVISQKYSSTGAAVGTSIIHQSSAELGDIAMMPLGEYVVAFGQFITVVQQSGTPFSPVNLGVESADIDVAVSATRIGVMRSTPGFGASIVTYDLNGTQIVGGPSSIDANTVAGSAIAALSNGGFVGVFTQQSVAGAPDARSINAMMAAADGTPLLGSSIVLADGLLNAQSVDVVGLKNGGFAITYAANSFATGSLETYDSFVKVFNADGSSAGVELVIQKSSSGLGYILPELTALSDGRLLVTWTELNNGVGVSDVKMQILDPRDGYFIGTAGIDKIYGHDGRVDEIHGQAGNDTIYGLAGADILYGDAGTDFLFGGRGDDTVRGGADTDYMYGDFGDDEQYGETGNDLMYSGRGADLLDGGVGSDTAYYTSEKTGAVINLLNQLLNAGSADGDTFVSVERFFGSEAAADNITGDNVSNTILGNGGADIINGSGGADVLRGGTGADTINGGTEGDFFQYTALNEVGDSIINFEAIDNFQFTRAAFGNLAGANVAAINFLSVASGHAATTAAHRFIFDQAVDQLWYDADGNAGGAAVMVADLSNNINITNLDLLLM